MFLFLKKEHFIRVFAQRKMLRLFLGFGVILSNAKHFLVIGLRKGIFLRW